MGERAEEWKERTDNLSLSKCKHNGGREKRDGLNSFPDFSQVSHILMVYDCTVWNL